jgi:hypothetical protein
VVRSNLGIAEVTVFFRLITAIHAETGIQIQPNYEIAEGLLVGPLFTFVAGAVEDGEMN